MNNASIQVGLVALLLTISGCKSGTEGAAHSDFDTESTITEQEHESERLAYTYVETFTESGALTSPSNNTVSQTLDALRRANLTLAVESLSGNGNTLHLPYDLMLNYGALAVGASGTTKTELMNAMGSCSELDVADLHVAIEGWNRTARSDSALTQERIFWGQTGYKFKYDYVDQFQGYYGADIEGLNFLQYPYESKLVIDAWQSEATPWLEDKYIAGELTAETRVFYSDASQIHGEWDSSAFNLVVEPGAHFKNLNGDLYEMPMMHLEGTLPYLETDKYSAYQLPISNSGFALLIIRPNVGEFSSFKNRLDESFFEELMESFELANVDIYLPPFSLDFEGGELVTEEAGSNTLADFSSVNDLGYLYNALVAQHGRLIVDSVGIDVRSVSNFQLDAVESEPEEAWSSTVGVTTWVGQDLTRIYENEFQFFPYGCESYDLINAAPFMYAVVNRKSSSIHSVGQYVDVSGDASAVGVSSECSISTPSFSLDNLDGSEFDPNNFWGEVAGGSELTMP